MPKRAWPIAHPWRRLLLCALLAVTLHLLMLALFGPRVDARYSSSIAQPLVYALQAAPPLPPVPPAAPKRPRPTRPAPALAPPPVPAPLAPPETPVAAAEPAPQEAEAEAAPAVAEAPPPPPPEPVAPPPALVPSSLRLSYGIQGEVKGLSYQAGGELLWAHDGQNYEARLEISAFLLGSRVQHSRGRITPEGLQPQRFSDRSRRERTAEFDYPQALVHFSEGTPDAPLTAGLQDQLSIFMQFASLLASQPASYPPGTEVTLQVADYRRATPWRFVVDGEETLRLPGGEVNTRKVSRVVQAGADELRVELWLAPSLGWLPARLRLSQPNGDYIDQRWRSSAAP